MDLSGDRLAVFLFLAGGVVAAFIGAIPAPERRSFWWTAAGFGLAAVIWVFLPLIDTLNAVVGPIAVSVVRSGAPLMIATVAIVALMLGQRPYQRAHTAARRGPPEFAECQRISKWLPDMTLFEGFMYVGTESKWAAASPGLLGVQVQVEMRQILHVGKITVWGKEHPEDTEDYQINRECWNNAQLDIERNYAFFNGLAVAAYDLRVARGEVESVWPRA